MKIFLVVLFLAAFSSYASAGGWFTENGEVEFLHIEKGLVLANINTTDKKYFDGCDSTDGVIINDDTENGKRQYALILSAFAAGKKVKIYTSGCHTEWGQKYPQVWAVRAMN